MEEIPYRLKEDVDNATSLLVTRPDLEFAGMYYYGIRKLFCDSSSFSRWCKDVSGDMSSFAITDGEKIIYLTSEKMKLEEFIYITLHNILHIICEHHFRSSNKDPLLWNLACDHIVNRLCMELNDSNSLVKLPPEGKYVFFEQFHYDNKTCSAEDVYEWLTSNPERYETQTFKMRGGSLQPIDGEGDPIDLDMSPEMEEEVEGMEIVKVTDTETGNSYLVAIDTDPTKVGKTKDDSAEGVLNRLGEAKADIQSMWNRDQLSKGSLPGDFAEYLNAMFKVEIPWGDILEDAIKYPARYSNKSWSAPDFYMPRRSASGERINTRLMGRKMSKSPYTLVCAIDSSGSISTEELKKFLGIVCSSHIYFKEIVVLVHDYVIQDEIVIKNFGCEEDVFEKIRSVKGRGGTSHKEVFQRIEAMTDDFKISSVIFLTDFYSDVEELYNNYSFMKDNETVWVLTSNNTEVQLEHCSTKTIHI